MLPFKRPTHIGLLASMNFAPDRGALVAVATALVAGGQPTSGMCRPPQRSKTTSRASQSVYSWVICKHWKMLIFPGIFFFFVSLSILVGGLIHNVSIIKTNTKSVSQSVLNNIMQTYLSLVKRELLLNVVKSVTQKIRWKRGGDDSATFPDSTKWRFLGNHYQIFLC